MSIDFRNLAFGRGAYIFLLALVVAALASTGIPFPIFACLLAGIVIVAVITEAASWLLARKLSSLSLFKEAGPVENIDVTVMLSSAFAFGVRSVPTSPAMSPAFDDMDDEFIQTEKWFATAEVGSFA